MSELSECLRQQRSAALQYCLTPTFIIRRESVFESPLGGMIQRSAAIVMPPVFLPQCVKHLDAGISPILADEYGSILRRRGRSSFESALDSVSGSSVRLHR
jgi:hypothetical protein